MNVIVLLVICSASIHDCLKHSITYIMGSFVEHITTVTSYNSSWKRNTNPYTSDIVPDKTNSNFQFFSISHIHVHVYLSPACIPG